MPGGRDALTAPDPRAVDATAGVARNALLKLGAHGTRALSLAFLVLAARVLGPDEFGRLTFAYALAALLAAALDLGMHPVLVRSMVREPGAIAAHWMAAATLKLGLLVPAGLALAVAPLLAGTDTRTILTVWLLGLAFACQAFTELSVSLFAARGRFDLDMALRLAEKLLLLIVGLIVLGLHAGVVAVAAVFAGSSAAALVAGVVVVRRRFARVPLAVDVVHARALARRLGPVAVAALCDLAKTRLIAPVVFVIAGEAAAGYFGAAFRVLDLLLVVPAAVVAAAYPELARSGPGDPAFRALVRRVLEVLLVLGLGVALALHAGAATLTRVVFGAAYAPTTPLLGLLGVAACLAFLNYFLSAVLLALERTRRLVTVSATGLVAALVLAPPLVARAGALGGGVALVVLEALTLAVSLAALIPLIGSPFGRDAAKALVAAAITALVATAWPGEGQLRTALTLAVYGAALLVLRPGCVTLALRAARRAA